MESKIHTQDENIAYWDSRATVHQDLSTATFLDVYLREREIDQVCNYLSKFRQPMVLDIGCGNGYGTFKYALRFPESNFRGEDISREMIKYALKNLEKLANPPTNLSFDIGDVTNLLHEDKSFDVVTTCRVLINLPTTDRQLEALQEINQVLRPGGVYIMLESCKQSYQKLNKLRSEFGLSELVPHEMNIYIDEELLYEWCHDFFEIEEVNLFSSLYYIGSRVAYPLLLGPEDKPKHDHPVNRLFAMLDSVGDYGREKIYLLRKHA